MEDDSRRLQPVKLDIIGTETGRERYLIDGWVLAPSIANWRNNLTACSQRHNLYFIAHQESIAVFQPSFPSNTLGHQPQIKIIPAIAKANARGRLDPSRPHSINHLVVGELGSEEILFLSTDSGNVAAYYTGSIQDGIEKEQHKFSQDGRGDLLAIRPFFTHWVYESAWGLSIHKHARMLAVSSNKPFHEPTVGIDAAVTVFAFALTSCDQPSIRLSNDGITSTKEDESEWSSWIPDAANPTRLPDRSLNWKTRLEAHTCNIPSLSFVNSDDDKEGNYLLSTDIQGITKCWHIWQRNVISTWNFSRVGKSSNPYLTSQATSSGWTVLALEPSSFQVVNTHEEFCGEPADHESSSGCVDITSSLCRIPGHDRSLVAGSAVPPARSDTLGEDNNLIGQFDDGFSDHENYEDSDQDVIHTGLSLELASSNSTGSGSEDHHLHSSSDEHSHIEAGDSSEIESGDETATGDLMRIDSQQAEDEDLPADWPDVSLPLGYNTSVLHEPQVGTNEAKKVKLHHPGMLPAFQQALPKSKGLQIPALHLSASHLRLFDANCPQQASIYCSELLSFQWPMYHATHPAIDRLNLTQYIPELGIVVVATQIGRVAVCSLTRKGSKGPFGLRVDWILPFESQEKSHERPLTHLLGIAVGPVQGHQLSRSSSVSDNDDDMEETWLRDRIDEDGVSTTFDAEVIRIRRGSDSGNTNDVVKNHANETPSRRNTRTPAKNTRRRQTPPRKWRSVRQAWPSRSEVTQASALMDEPGSSGLEYSRRYRLMLTYYDQTVMTYELSRGRPFVGDPALGRPNWRNREDFV